MLIAFEGPDNTGKSTTAADISSSGYATYNATQDNYRAAKADMSEPGAESLVATFDRIDWLTHMVYRLAMPTHDWNDERPRTVFAMPDTHLVINLHEDNAVDSISDELYASGRLRPVNDMYAGVADWLITQNGRTNYSLFRSITLCVVDLDQENGIFQRGLLAHYSPWATYEHARGLDLSTNAELLDLLGHAEQHSL